MQKSKSKSERSTSLSSSKNGDINIIRVVKEKESGKGKLAVEGKNKLVITNDYDRKLQILKLIQDTSQSYNYSDNTKSVKEKAQRIESIEQILSMIADSKVFEKIILPNIQELFQMIKKNIFRPLPILKCDISNNLKGAIEGEVGGDEVMSDPSWNHIKGIYEIFFQLVINPLVEESDLKKLLTSNFLNEFVQLFNSEEAEERDYLKNILHRLYSKTVSRRKSTRRIITNTLQTLISELDKFNGVSEILDFYASIISGFSTPLRPEHIETFKNMIIPLHKVQSSSMYFENLVRCTMLFLLKDSKLVVPLIEGLLKYWPFGNYSKEMDFIKELAEAIEFTQGQMHIMKDIVVRLFKRLAKCIGGDHIHISMSVVTLFESETFVNLVKTYKAEVFEILVPVKTSSFLSTRISKHRDLVELNSSINMIQDFLKEIDKNLYNETLKRITSFKADLKLQEKRKNAEERWDFFSKKALKNQLDFEIPLIPFNEKTALAEYNSVYRNICELERGCK